MRESTAIHHNLGYSPQSAVNRVIKDGSQFDSLFPKPDGKKILLKKDGEVDETVQFMKQIVNDCNYQTKKIAEKIAVRKKDGSLDEKASVQSLWNFVVDYIKYNIEAGEQLRTPAKTWYDAQVCARQHPGVNDPQHSADCDCMSIFCGCVLLNWGIPFSFRITGYSDVLGICHGYQHVYTIAHCKGENVICDPVYHLFNAEKPFEIQKTYAMSLNGCDIYALSGIPDEDEELGVTEYYETPDGSLGVLGGKAKRKARKAKRKAKKAKRKAAKKEKKAAKKEKKAAKKEIRKARKSGDKAALAAAKEKKAAAKDKIRNAKETIRENRTGVAKVATKVGRGVAKFVHKSTMFLPRAGFLMLIRLNFRGMARKFANNQEAYKRFAKKWKNIFGGKESKLKKAIEKGKKKKAFFGKGKNVNGLEGDLYEIGTVLGNYGMISRNYVAKLARHNQELNPGLGIEPVTMTVGAAITAAMGVVSTALSIFQQVKDIIPSNRQEAEEQGMDSMDVDEDKYISEDPDNMEEDDEESEETMEGYPLRGIEDGCYYIDDVAINGIPRTVICKKDECGNISVLGALNGKKKAARKAKKAAKKAAKKEKKAAKKEAKKEKKAAKKAAKKEKKAAKKEMKKAKKAAKKEAKKLGLSKKEAKKYVKEKKKEAKKEYKAKKKEIKATKKAAVKEAKAKKKEAKKAVKAAKKEAKQAFKQAKKEIKQQKKAAKAEKKAAKKAAKQQTTYDVDEPIKDYENNEVEVFDDDMNVVDTDMDMDNTVDSGVDNAEFDENFDNADNDISIEPNEDGEDFSDSSDDFADGGAENDPESGEDGDEDGDEDFFDSPEDAAAASGGKKNKKRTASADSEDGEDSDGEDEETAEEKKKSSKKKLIIGGVVLAALGGLGFWLYKRKKQQPTASNTKSLKA